MPVLTTPGMIREIRRFAEDAALDQTYTKIPIVAVTDSGGAPVLDDWGQQVTVQGAAVSGLACKLRTVESFTRDDRGAWMVRRPFLWIRHDDPIAPGDLVTEVRDGEGRLLLSQATVLRAEATPVGVGTVTTAVELDGAEAVPLPAPVGGA